MKNLLAVIFVAFAFIACDKGVSEANISSQANATKPSSTTSATPYKDTSITDKGEKFGISHSLGDIEVVKKPKKVVVFDFGTLDTLEALGLSDVVVGVPAKNVPKYLQKFKDITSVGSVIEPNLETINELKPDLIIISGRQAKFYNKFNEIAPTLFVSIDNANFVDSFTNKIDTIATLWDKNTEANKAIEALKKQIENAKSAISADKKGLILLTNANRMSAFGSSSRFGIIHDVIGIPVVDESIKVGTHGNSVNAEYIAEKNPDFIFVVDRNVIVGNKERAQTILDNALVAKTNAAKNGKIIYLDPEYWYLSGGGLESLKAMIEEVSKAIK